MNSASPFLIIYLLLVGSLVSCEKLSAVFVLEASDSDSSTAAVTDSNDKDNNSNTRIISDTPKLTTSSSGSRRDQQATSRKLDEESQVSPRDRQKVLNPVTRASNNQQQQSSSSPTNSNNKPKSTTNSYDQDHSTTTLSSAPKTEERLLISIQTSDDDEDYKPPPKHIGSSNNHNGVGNINNQQHNNNDEPLSQQPKRKPSITISIQDANIGKQEFSSSGQSSGSPSVIVRPSENGQSIVISTVSGGGGVGLLPSSHPQNGSPINKPISSGPHVSSNHNNNNVNHQNGHHQREVEVPIQHQGNNNGHHTTHTPYITSTTHKPSSSSLTHRPLISTLLDPPRQPVHSNDERPQRPPVVSSGDDYSDGPINRPTSASNRPPVVDTSPYGGANNGNNGGDYDTDSSSSSGSSSSSSASSSEVSKYPLNEKNCGLVHETRIVGGEEANPDDFLWMAAIIKSKPTGDGEARPFCGGSLITRRHVLTAAHCLENLAPRDVLVRLGSYDFDDATASSLSADYAIDQFRVPAHYSKKTHAADIAIMRLKTPLSLQDNYKTVCMPQPRRSYVGALATVTGYGSQSQTFRRATPKLRQVTVPIWENRKCSIVYKKNLTESFLCAGYEEGGKDACQGDSGGPLMTEGPNERMMIVGVVSHGIGCGSPGYPGVYTRTTTYVDWIEKNTKE